MRILLTGGAGFLGSHLADSLVARGDSVICVDNLSTGSLQNLAGLLDHPRFEFIEADVVQSIPYLGHVDAVAHLASPASPRDYLAHPLETLAVGSAGTKNALDLARRHGARFLLASTSEVYGDPLVHPQPEWYLGNVSSVGPRSAYGEASRFGEALTSVYLRTYGLNAGIIRVFDTYGPRMRPDDGRAVSSFIAQALNAQPITIYGDGNQTRTFCYVQDLVRGIVAMLDSDVAGPINLGNPVEYTVGELADMVAAATRSQSPTEFHPLPQDDPTRRQPHISRASKLLQWTPRISLPEGLQRTIAWFRSHPSDLAAASVALEGPRTDGPPADLDLTDLRLQSAGVVRLRAIRLAPAPNYATSHRTVDLRPRKQRSVRTSTTV